MRKFQKYSFLFIFSLFFIAPSVVGINANISHASEDQVMAGDTPFEAVGCRVYNILVGTPGKILASVVIITLGMGFFTGKVSWGLMIGAAAGIGAMFGAPTIVNFIAGGDDEELDCSDVE
jgi:type IV secretory pathway VirB2 component (pilin)